jgi:hypothetical protein
MKQSNVGLDIVAIKCFFLSLLIVPGQAGNSWMHGNLETGYRCG